MRINCIISEFNPFHNGHKYLINKIKSDNDGYIAVIMSGSFVQRGDAAIFDKFSRAKCAILNGADLVVELPVVRSVAPAEKFALGGVEIANALNCTEIFFGSECGEIEKLKKTAEITSSDFIDSYIKENLKTGSSYPAILTEAVKNTCGEAFSDLLKSPNNALGIEYIKAINKINKNIIPKTVKRKAVSHQSTASSGNFASASFIRNEIINSNYNFENLTDKSSYNIIRNEIKNNNISLISNLEKTILYKLKTLSIENLSALPEISEGIENRIFSAAKKSFSLDELISKIKTKRYTEARIRRILIYALLNITKELQEKPVSYIKPLLFNENGRKILSQIKTLPIISKTADYKKILSGEQQKIFETDIFSTDIRNLATNNLKQIKNDFTEKIFFQDIS